VSKNEVSAILVALAFFVAYVVRDSVKRSKSKGAVGQADAGAAGASTQLPSGAQSQEASASTASTDAIKGTPRERRQEALRSMAQGEKCIYCSSPADHPFPYPEFIRHDGSMPRILGVPGAMLRAAVAWISGDLQTYWRVVEPDDGSHVLCSSHATIARSAVEVMLAKAHTDLVDFISTQKRSVLEYRAHGLDEDLNVEAERVRKGGTRK
jgi:hypothetical protein